MRYTILVLLLLPAAAAFAYKEVPPELHNIPSGNGAFIFDVDSQTERLTVFPVGKRDQPLWSFIRPIRPGERLLLSNDGNVVAIVYSRFVQLSYLDQGMCVEFWGCEGKLKEYRFADLCPNPARLWPLETGPVGSFWRRWYSKADGDGDTLCVRTTDEFAYVFAMDDGSIVKATRIGLPSWAWWALLASAAVGARGLLVLWRRQKRRISERSVDPNRHGRSPFKLSSPVTKDSIES